MSEQIRIAFIEQDSGIGGAEINLFYLFEGMNKEQFYPIVVVPYEGHLTNRLKETGIRYQVIPRVKFIFTSIYLSGRKIFNPFALLYDIFVILPAIWRLKIFLKREKIDVVHTNSILAHIYGGIAAKTAGIPCIWHMQDIVDPKMALGIPRRALVFLGRILPKKIVVVSKAVGQMFNGSSVQKVKVVYNGTDTEKFSPEIDGSAIRKEFNIADAELVVGMVGRLTEWKGQREFLRASSLVAKEVDKVKFMIVGSTTFSKDEYLEELKKLTDDLGLSKKVIFTGFRNDIPNIIAAMDICVLPSILPDPCPLTLFDYMAAEKPVIASQSGGIPEIIEHGKDGFLVDPKETDKLADAIIQLLKDSSLRQRIAKAARKKVMEKFSVDNFVAQFQRIYLEVLN